MMRALGSLPHFHTLELSWQKEQPRGPVGVLSGMLVSRSWRTLHLHASPKSISLAPSNPGGGLLKQLTSLSVEELERAHAAERIRVAVFLRGRLKYLFRIAIDKGTHKLEWQRQ
jgi:hypothetical protein